jgi:hypothetical protein
MPRRLPIVLWISSLRSGRWIAVDLPNLAYATTPGTFVDFIDLVVPELQRRGRYWHDYDEGTTLRERLCGPGHPRVRDDHPAARYRRALEGSPEEESARTAAVSPAAA